VLNMGRNTFKGDLKMRGLPDFLSTDIDFEVKQLSTSISEVRRLFPQVRIPKNFDKLGNVVFAGRFRGFPQDFVAEEVRLRSDIGRITNSDLNMKIGEQITYSGDIVLKDFDLGIWLNDTENFGKLSLEASLKEGHGTTLNNLYAIGEGNISEITLYGYTYTNLLANGKMDKKLFEGRLRANDTNLKLDFRGLVNLNGAIPEYNFKANVATANLYRLNLLKSLGIEEEVIISGNTDLDLMGNSIDDMQGTATFKEVHFQRGDKSLALKNVAITSDFNTKSNIRTLDLQSDVLKVKLKGTFNFDKLPRAIQSYLHNYFPHYVPFKGDTPDQRFVFHVKTNDPLELTQFFDPKLTSLKRAVASGNIDTGTKELFLNFQSPEITYNGTVLQDTRLELTSDVEELYFEGDVATVRLLAQDVAIPLVNTAGSVAQDVVAFNLNVAGQEAENRFDVDALLFANSDTLKVDLTYTELVFQNKKWEAETGSFLFRDKNYFVIEDILLTNGKELVTVRSYPSPEFKNLTEIYLGHINIEDLDYVKAINTLKLKGFVNGTVSLKDIFNQQIITADLIADDFEFMEQTVGKIKAKVNKLKNDPKLEIIANVEDSLYNISANGHYHLEYGNSKQPYIDIDTKIAAAPVHFVEAFVGSFVSNTTGTAKGTMRIVGKPNNPEFEGRLLLRNTATTIDYLQTRYQLHNQLLAFERGYIRFNNMAMNDRFNNTARVNGYINMRSFENIRLGVSINTDNFLFMETELSDNELFYGTAFGSGIVNFEGPVSRLQMKVNATSEKGTKIFLPISSDTEIDQGGFYTFINTGVDTIKKEKKIDLSGFLMDFNLDLNTNAELQLIFDYQAGDIIRAKGDGNMRMLVNTIGDFDFSMYGAYTIAEGDYLFTLPDIFFQKYFELEKGGTLQFNGNPYDARLNLNAIYKRKASRYNLLSQAEQESYQQLNDNDAITALKKQVPVEVYMGLTGSLSAPNIGFDVKIPERSITRVDIDELINGKLRRIKNTNANELNKQVAGLLLFNQFMPPEEIDFDIRSGGQTLVSEFLSNYVSNYLNTFITNIDPNSELSFSIRNYDFENYTDDLGSPDSYVRSEVGLAYSRNFNDRLKFIAEGNLDVGQGALNSQGDTYALAGDFMIIYNLTPDGKYTLKGYYKYDYDILEGNYNKTGVGISINQEFDSFKELFKKKE
ncbi:MAG: translocation/assembly module TamB domain-containing protein, partial [Chitinophagales bacterium]